MIRNRKRIKCKTKGCGRTLIPIKGKVLFCARCQSKMKRRLG